MEGEDRVGGRWGEWRVAVWGGMEKLELSRRKKWRSWGKRGKGRKEHTDTLAKERQWVEVWRRAWQWELVLHTFPGKWEKMTGHREPPSQHTHLSAGALHSQEVALMYKVSNRLHLPLQEQSFGTRPEIHQSNTAFTWCKQCALGPAPALTVCLPRCGVVISHTVVTQHVLPLWLDNVEQLQEPGEFL